MLQGILSAPKSEWLGRIRGTLFGAALAGVLCTGIGQVVFTLMGRTCILSCLVSMALAWASHVAAYGVLAGSWGMSHLPAVLFF